MGSSEIDIEMPSSQTLKKKKKRKQRRNEKKKFGEAFEVRYNKHERNVEVRRQGEAEQSGGRKCSVRTSQVFFSTEAACRHESKSTQNARRANFSDLEVTALHPECGWGGCTDALAFILHLLFLFICRMP